MCRPEIDKLVADNHILYDYIGSDHKPLSVKFNEIVRVCADGSVKVDRVKIMQPCWSNVNESTLLRFEAETNRVLSKINVIPCSLTTCSLNKCTNCNHKEDINVYYNDIILYLKDVFNQVIPSKLA
jgi:hypothetical protein